MAIGELVKTALHRPPAKEETFAYCEKIKFEEEIMRICNLVKVSFQKVADTYQELMLDE